MTKTNRKEGHDGWDDYADETLQMRPGLEGFPRHDFETRFKRQPLGRLSDRVSIS
jgi:hypothetical protein